jgi:hypothetical protein
LILVGAFSRLREFYQIGTTLSYSIFILGANLHTYIIGCPCGCCCLCIVNILIILTIIQLLQRLEINTIIVDQLFDYFRQLVTDFIQGNNTVVESWSRQH